MLILVPTDRMVTIANTVCPYCGKALTSGSRTRDHVVARKFVPEGTLLNSFNIGLWACSPCNGKKARLEDDISAITMLSDTAGRYARDDERLRRSSARKARGSISASTKTPVGKSHPHLKIDMPLQGASLSVNLVGHPHIDPERAARLAWMQLQGFWFFQGFNRAKGWGASLPTAKFHMIGLVSRADWGNPQIRAFASQMSSLDPQLHGVLADGYFRASIGRFDGEDTLAWALEWNEAFRCFGYWGEPVICLSKIAKLPKLEMSFLAGDTTNGIAAREQVPLAEDDDCLFRPPKEFASASLPEKPHWQ